MKDQYDIAWGYVRHILDQDMTKAQWIDWWEQTGQFSNRGRKKSNVCMWRIDQEKPYSFENIELLTVEEAAGRKAKLRGK